MCTSYFNPTCYFLSDMKFVIISDCCMNRNIWKEKVLKSKRSHSVTNSSLLGKRKVKESLRKKPVLVSKILDVHRDSKRQKDANTGEVQAEHCDVHAGHPCWAWWGPRQPSRARHCIESLLTQHCTLSVSGTENQITVKDDVKGISKRRVFFILI